MNIFSGRVASLLTKHGKERVISVALEPTACIVKTTDAYDTDLLGTFTLDTPRLGTQRDAARKKAELGMALLGTDLALANEGVFVSDPYAGILPWNNELIVLIDQKHQLEITGFSSAPAQNARAYVSHWEELETFAHTALFPSHHLVVKPTDEYHSESIKSICALDQLKEAFEWAAAQSLKGVVYVENDLRAFANPTRMENIRQAANNLAQKMTSLCPQCQAPGYWVKEIQRGLPCKACGLPTTEPLCNIWACMCCDYQSSEGMKVFKLADPSNCPHCNP